MKWNDLTMKKKASLIKEAIKHDMLKLSDIKNNYDDGGYLSYIEQLAKKKAKDWEKDEDEVLTMLLNDNTYNYKAFYDNNREQALAMLTENPEVHFSDVGKTVYHPTFSNESIYSGKKSDYNPRGTVGGRWENSEYRPSYSQIINEDFDYNKTKDYLEGSGESVDSYYKDIYSKLDNMKKYPNFLTLETYYPIISKFAKTGHSSLGVAGIIPNSKGDAQIGSINIDKGSKNKDYNLIANNCSDATRCGLEEAFGKKLNAFLFTTPGDVQDWALEELGGIPKIKGDSIFNPIEGRYIIDNSSNNKKKKERGTSTVYIPANKKQREKLIEYIRKGKEENKFDEGGELRDNTYVKLFKKI